MRVLQFNVCGTADQCPSKGAVEFLAENVANSINSSAPDVVTLNEACSPQVDRIIAEAEGHWVKRFATAKKAGGECGDYGNAILTRTEPVKHRLNKALYPAPENAEPSTEEQRRLLCVIVRLRGQEVQVCSTHLAAGSDGKAADIRHRQAAEIMFKHLRPAFDADRPLILAGDFNAEPGDRETGPFYRDEKLSDAFTGRDRCSIADAPCDSDVVTYNILHQDPVKKIDYVLFSDHFTDRRGTIHPPRQDEAWEDHSEGEGGRAINPHGYLSDHKLLRAQGTLGGGGGPDDPPVDAPPVADAGPDRGGDEGSSIELAGSASDDRSTPSVRWSYSAVGAVDPGTECGFSPADAARASFTCNDDGVFDVTLTATDSLGQTSSDTARVTVDNVAPEVTLTGAEDWQAFRTPAEVESGAAISDPGTNDAHTCEADWDDGTGDTGGAESDACTLRHTYDAPGMYTIKVGATDDDGASGSGEVMVVAYDTNGASVTAIGEFRSPAGANADDPDATGPVWVDATPLYLLGGPKPVGLVGFGPGVGGLLGLGADGFRATELEWLVVTPDGKFAVKGSDARKGTGFVLYGHLRGDHGLRMVIHSGAHPTAENSDYDNVRGAGYDVDRFTPQRADLEAAAVTAW